MRCRCLALLALPLPLLAPAARADEQVLQQLQRLEETPLPVYGPGHPRAGQPIEEVTHWAANRFLTAREALPPTHKLRPRPPREPGQPLDLLFAEARSFARDAVQGNLDPERRSLGSASGRNGVKDGLI